MAALFPPGIEEALSMLRHCIDPYQPGCELDDPRQFDRLSLQEQQELCDWLQENFIARPSLGDHACSDSSYKLKHAFQFRADEHAGEPPGFYVTNGAFKGALLACGFPICDKRELNWRPKLRRRHCMTAGCPGRPSVRFGLCRRCRLGSTRHPVGARGTRRGGTRR